MILIFEKQIVLYWTFFILVCKLYGYFHENMYTKINIEFKGNIKKNVDAQDVCSLEIAGFIV